MNRNILLILHLPPPITGATMVGKHISQSKIINDAISIEYVNLTTSTGLNQNGKSALFVKAYNFFKIQINLLRALSKKKYTLCYLTLTAKGSGFYKDLIIVSFLKLFGVKVIYHFHNKGVQEGSKSSINRKLYKYAFKNTKSILLSPRLYYDIAPFVSQENVYYCPNGMPDMAYKIKKNQLDTKENDPCQLLFLSNMMLEKGVLVLLEACKVLKERKLSFECNFIGAWSDISEEYFTKRCEEFGIQDEVLAHGKKYGDEKMKYFGKADIFVFPTFYHYETFGLVILEAMQAELPVISTFEGGIPDVVEDGKTGILVQQQNVLELADKLELLILNPSKRKQMGMAGRKRYEELFTLNVFEERLKSILDKEST